MFTLFSAHLPVLHAHEYGADQVHVAEPQRDDPDPELLGTSKDFVGTSLLLSLDELLTS